MRLQDSLVEERLQLSSVEVSLLADPLDVASVEIIEQRVLHLALLARHPAAGEDVGRVLVGADAEEFRLHSQLVEARGGEQCRRGKTIHRQDGLRSSVNPVG